MKRIKARLASTQCRFLEFIPSTIFFFFLICFVNKPMFRDEAFSLYSATQSLGNLINEITKTNFVYIIYYIIGHFWVLFAKNIIWLRVLSLLAFSLSVYSVQRITLRILSRRTSFIAAIFVATNPLFIQEALYARPYALAGLLSVIFIALTLNLQSDSNWHNHLLFVVGILLCLIEISAVFVVIPTFFLLLSFKTFKAQKMNSKLIAFVMSSSVVIFIFMIFSLNQSEGLNWITSYFNSIPLWINFEGPASSSTGLFPIAGSGLYPIGVFALLCLGLLSYLTTQKNKTQRLVDRWDLGLIATWAFLPTLAMVGISLVHPIYITRYITYSVPGLAILMAIASESVYTNFTLIKSQIVKPILFSSVLGAALVWTFITCDIPVAKTYAYNLWSAEKYLASSGGPNAEIVLPTISLKTAIAYYANVDHNSFTYWPQGKNIWSATSLNLEKATFASASSNVWLVYENSYDDAPIIASLREHGYAQSGTTLIEGVALIHFEKH